VTRTQFAVALVVLFAGGVVGGMVSDHLRGGTVAWAQEDGKPLQIDDLVVKKLLVLDSVMVKDEERDTFIGPGYLQATCGGSQASLRVSPQSASLTLDGAAPADISEFFERDWRRLGEGSASSPWAFSVFASSDGYTSLRLGGTETKEEVSLCFLPRFGPSLDLRDRAGNIRVTLGPNDNGIWQVGVANADGRGRFLEAGN
jgi:hypothetical protein